MGCHTENQKSEAPLSNQTNEVNRKIENQYDDGLGDNNVDISFDSYQRDTIDLKLGKFIILSQYTGSGGYIDLKLIEPNTNKILLENFDHKWHQVVDSILWVSNNAIYSQLIFDNENYKLSPVDVVTGAKDTLNNYIFLTKNHSGQIEVKYLDQNIILSESNLAKITNKYPKKAVTLLIDKELGYCNILTSNHTRNGLFYQFSTGDDFFLKDFGKTIEVK